MCVSEKDKKIVRDYFEAHPEHRDGVFKAYHAWISHYREHPDAHNFFSVLRSCKCKWCGRTREEVRYDDYPPECLKRPANAAPDIEKVIFNEEEKYLRLLKSAEKIVPKLVKKLGMSGETLAVLHHTHGFDPETVAGVVDIPKQVMIDYYEHMEKERELSRASLVKEIITVQGL